MWFLSTNPEYTLERREAAFPTFLILRLLDDALPYSNVHPSERTVFNHHRLQFFKHKRLFPAQKAVTEDVLTFGCKFVDQLEPSCTDALSKV